MADLLIIRGAVASGKSEVARAIMASRTDVRVVEVDFIKCRKYGTTARCTPNEDFPEAGREARRYLEKGFHTILVEAFVEKCHLDMALEAAGRMLRDVSIVWLDCRLETSLLRKCNTLTCDVVRCQHDRYGSRYLAPGESVVSTDDRSVDRVVEDVLTFTRFAASGVNEGT